MNSEEIKEGAFDMSSVSSVWAMNSTLCSLQRFEQQSKRVQHSVNPLRGLKDLAVQQQLTEKFNRVP